MTQQDTLAAIASADAKVTAVQADQATLIQKVTDLTTALANASTPVDDPAVVSALAALNTHLDTVQAAGDAATAAPAPAPAPVAPSEPVAS